MPISHRSISLLAAGFMLSAAGLACAQDYPSKPVHFVKVSAGGGSDLQARLVAQAITGPLGQPVIVDNRTTTNAIGQEVAKAPADGYTMVVSGNSLYIGRF